MKKVIATTLAAAGLFGANLAQSAGADLSVRGKLQSGACNVVLGNGGAVDLGSMKATQLSSSQTTYFQRNAMSLTVTCATATRFGLRIDDNRADTHFDGDLYGEGAGMSLSVFGLGVAAGKRIGEYIVTIRPGLGDGQPVDMLYTYGFVPGGRWSRAGSGSGVTLSNTGTTAISFTEANGAAPAALASTTATVDVSGLIDRADNLDLNQEIRIDGSATLELIYL